MKAKKRNSGRNSRRKPTLLHMPDWEDVVIDAGDIYRRVLRERKDIAVISDAIKAELGNQGREVLPPRDSYVLLERLAEIVLEDAKRIGNQQSYHRWLQNLRQMPDICYGALGFKHAASTIERRMRVEALASMTAGPPAKSFLGRTAQQFTIRPHDLLPILRFAKLGCTYANLQVLMRCAAKGVPIRFELDSMPDVDDSHPAWDDVESLDARRDELGEIVQVAVAAGLPFALAGEHKTDRLSLGCFYAPTGALPFTEDWSIEPGIRGAQFAIATIGSPLPTLMADHDWYSHRLPLLCYAATSLLYFIPRASVEFQVNVRAFGHVVVLLEDVVEAFSRWRHSPHAEYLYRTFPHLEGPYTDKQLIDCLFERSAESVNRSGPPISHIGAGAVMLDFAAMTEQVHSESRVVRTDAVSGPRSTLFEIQTQDLIDRTKWAPPEQLKRYIRRSLKALNGQVITDIDAVAALGDCVIFIDCKGYTNDAYGRGGAHEVYSLKKNLTDDCERWLRRIERLKNEPIGRNYDFSGIRTFVPLVLTLGPCLLDSRFLAPQQTGWPVSMSVYELIPKLETS